MLGAIAGDVIGSVHEKAGTEVERLSAPFHRPAASPMTVC